MEEVLSNFLDHGLACAAYKVIVVHEPPKSRHEGCEASEIFIVDNFEVLEWKVLPVIRLSKSDAGEWKILVLTRKFVL
jgi:hypothetical protein